MDLNALWALIESSAAEASGQAERLAAAVPSSEAVEFAPRLDEVRRRVDTWAHRRAAGGFFSFQAWLAGQGREVFESVVSSPDALADLPQVQDLASRGGVHAWADADWPDREGLDHLVGEAFGGDLRSVPASRGPRVGALFGKVA